MLSPKQKKALFGASIESRPRYVRVPLQMVNSVRELNTDVNFARLVAQFEQTDDRIILARLLGIDHPIEAFNR